MFITENIFPLQARRSAVFQTKGRQGEYIFSNGSSNQARRSAVFQTKGRQILR